jgi:hypothetical protein
MAGMTQSPFCSDEEGEPVETTSKTPSLPGMAEGSEVPIREVKGGLEPYVPWTVLISAGLMGAASVRTSTEFEGIDGEIE